ncbi:MAG: hypothetical protein ACE5HL_03835 [Terriglobia bacterium]
MASPQKEERAIFEAIRQGKAPPVVKRQASRGSIPVATDELLEILVLLTRDPDPTCSEVAKQTLAGWPTEKCAALLAQPETSPAVLAYFASQQEVPEAVVAAVVRHPNADDPTLAALAGRLPLETIQQMASPGDRFEQMPQFVAALLERSDLPESLRARLEKLARGQPPAPEKPAEAPTRKEAEIPPEERQERVSLLQRVAHMGISERVQLALKGSKDERLLLIRDPNKVVYRAVLQSPKLSDSEVETFASMKNIAEEALRIIASKREFMKNYAVARRLVNNPRTPVDISLNLINRLINYDLKVLSVNRNVPQTVRSVAIKLRKQRIARGETR